MSTPIREVLADGVEVWLGDCREVLPMLPKADAVVTDPPYRMEFRSNHRANKYDAIAGDGEGWPLRMAAQLSANHSRYVFCRWDDLQRVPKPRSLVTWVKNNWSMGDLKHEHARQTEVILFYPGPHHFFPDVRPQDVIRAPRSGNEFHPTEKPVQLMTAVCRWTAGTILDPFMGSGTTGVAAATLGRKFVGIEIKRKYFDVACRRITESLRQPCLFDAFKPQQQVLAL